MHDILGRVVGWPFILVGMALMLVAEGAIRLGAFFAGYQVKVGASDSDD